MSRSVGTSLARGSGKYSAEVTFGGSRPKPRRGSSASSHPHDRSPENIECTKTTRVHSLTVRDNCPCQPYFRLLPSVNPLALYAAGFHASHATVLALLVSPTVTTATD